jgi:GTP-binding protein
LLAAVTNAKPKIGPYAFTTLEPNLGVANLDLDTSLVLADIPGLMEGAHQGAGLGHDFLRHIQRTRVLIHLLDGLSTDPLLDYAQINSELALFDPNLRNKPQVVALNKMDLPDVQARWPEIKQALQKIGLHPERDLFSISAATGMNVKQVLYRTAQLLIDIPPVSVVTEIPVYRPEEDPRQFTIHREPEGWRVAGEAIERAAEMTYWSEYQSIRRFQRILETLGIDKALRKAGVQEGDTVFIRDYELVWQD